MSKRALAAMLWFAAIWFGYEIVWSLTGSPRIVGPILAASVAAIVTIDPVGRIWARSTRRYVDNSNAATGLPS
jgi:hypothetical protein